MYQPIHGPRKISSAQKEFFKEIREALPPAEGIFTIGHQGDNFELNDLRSNGLIWFGHFKLKDAKVPRYWNGFGLASELVLSGSNNIIAEANVALDGNHPRAKSVAAFFAEDSNGSVVLIHTGKVGGGQEGVGKSAFLSWYGSEVCEFLNTSDSKKPEQGILLAELGQNNIAESIEKFVRSVAQFKAEISRSSGAEPSDEELKNKAKSARKKPKASTSVTVTYSRNKHVARYAKKRAKGRCDLCRDAAPFADDRGELYLECHHITWLAHNGEDSIDNTVALCPNCHRRMHIVSDPKDVKKLQKRASRIL